MTNIEALGLENCSIKTCQVARKFEEAKNFGSLIQPCMDERSSGLLCAMPSKQRNLGASSLRETPSSPAACFAQAKRSPSGINVVVAHIRRIWVRKGDEFQRETFLESAIEDYK